jgi:periplasmic protein TonB
MKAKIYLNSLFIIIVISATILSSCRSSFPTGGTAVNCNGQLLKPILNPTKRPVFPGGQQAMHKFVVENINLPQETIIKGKVRVAFIVTNDGETCDVRITSKPKEYIDNEVARVIKMMPKWIPGTNEGKIVDSYYLLDIRF